ncbi:MAG: methyltransferase domain-containing protein [Myxococcales bacterium]|nr:methyltransferase domain-containing protein [Myxococcales bacterium]
MEFTGERYVPAAGWASIAYEHLSRYLMALPHARGKSALDVGCGEGYGTRLLASHADDATGIDVSPEAVRHARARYGAEASNLRYLVGSASLLPFPDRTFDLVTCFEMLEHIEEHDALLGEIRRVLRPGGLLLISTPNKHAYSDVPNYRNEYHVRELYFEEFRALVAKHFLGVAYFSQKNVTGSLIAPVDEKRARPFEVRRIHRVNEHNEFAPADLGDCDHLYYIAACSDDPTVLAPLHGLIVADRDERLAREAAEVESARHADRERSHAKALEIRDGVVELRGEAEQIASRALREERDARALRRERPGPEQGRYTILLAPAHGAESFRATLSTLLRFTDPRHSIEWVVDANAGADPGPDLLSTPEAAGRVRRRAVAPGTTRRGLLDTALRGTDGDVVLVTDPLEFTPDWLARLDRCRRSDPRIGAVVPFGVSPIGAPDDPRVPIADDEPGGRARRVVESARFRYPRMPSASIGCVLLTHSARRAVDGFDPNLGDPMLAELDLSRRLWSKGFEVAVADDAFVPRVSEGPAPARGDLDWEGALRLWPEYERTLIGWLLMNPLRSQCLDLARDGAPPIRVLHVCDRFSPTLAETLRAASAGEAHGIVMPRELPASQDLELSKTSEGLRVFAVNQLTVNPIEVQGVPRSPLSEHVFAELLLGLDPLVVHFHVTAALGSAALPAMTRALGIPTVVDFGAEGPESIAERSAVEAAAAVVRAAPAARAAFRSRYGETAERRAHETAASAYGSILPNADTASEVLRSRMRRDARTLDRGHRPAA